MNSTANDQTCQVLHVDQTWIHKKISIQQTKYRKVKVSDCPWTSQFYLSKGKKRNCKGDCGAELNRVLAGGPKLIYYYKRVYKM